MAGYIETDLDKIQSRLHDDGTLWSRAELLRYYNDGYRQLLAQSKCTRRLHILDVPGRIAYAGVYEWEDRHSSGGTYRRFSRVSERNGWFSTTQWEIEQLRGITPTTSSFAATQLWERAFAGGDLNTHFRFYLGAHHDSIIRVVHDNDRLGGVAVRSLDTQDTSWFNEGGEPTFFTPGVGRDRTFEVFEVVTTYNAPYEYNDSYTRGGVRKLSGSRTYSLEVSKTHQNDYAYSTRADAEALEQAGDTPLFGLGNADLRGYGFRFTLGPTLSTDGFPINVWEREQIDLINSSGGDDGSEVSQTTGELRPTHVWESEFSVSVDPPLGALRAAHSPNRQYAPQAYNPGDISHLGVVRSIGSSDDSITVLEVIQPPRPLVESDAPSLIPRRMSKYLRYYTLGKAYGAEGEGQRPDISQHYLERYDRGIKFMMRLAEITFHDRVYQRQDVELTRRVRPPRVRLPSTFPRVL